MSNAPEPAPEPVSVEHKENAPDSRDYAAPRRPTVKINDTHNNSNGHDSANSASFVDVEKRKHRQRRRVQTDLGQEPAIGPTRHKYIFRRPRALIWTEDEEIIELGRDRSRHLTPENSHGESPSPESSMPDEAQRRGIENVNLQRRRLDLFIDLVWVGIVGNLSEVYAELFLSPEGSTSNALLITIAAFLPTWRIWNYFRDFLNSYYMDDAVQRVFLFWIMVLSLFYGNFLAYLAKDPNTYKNLLIVIYLIVRSSIVLMEAFYSLFIPWLRRQVLVGALLMIPGLTMWVTAIYRRDSVAAGLVFGGTFYDYIISMLILSPAYNKLLRHGIKKALNTEHFVERMEGFYLIVLGEGVFLLIKGGPLGDTIHSVAANSVWALLIYTILAYLYFNGDSSRSYIHALKRSWWRALLWTAFHITLFCNLLIVGACMTYLITGQAGTFKKDEGTVYTNDEERNIIDQRAIWSMAASLSIVMFCLLVLALLNRSMDKPNTLKINNRYIRLLPRALFVVIVMCLPINHASSPQLFLGIVSLLLYIIMAWEWGASLEKGGGWFEPKSEAGSI